MTTIEDQTLRALLTAMVALNDLPHPRHAGRILLAVALAGNGCSDDVVARTAEISVSTVREIIPSMLDRCLHVPALVMAGTNRTPAGVLYTGIRLTGEGQRRVLLLIEVILRPNPSGIRSQIHTSHDGGLEEAPDDNSQNR